MFKFIKSLFKRNKHTTLLGESTSPRPFPTNVQDSTNITFITPTSAEQLKQMFYQEPTPKEFIWYSPEWNEIRIATKEAGYLFKDEIGEHHLCYKLDRDEPFLTKPFYLIGEL